MNTHTKGPWKVQPDPEWAGKHPLHDRKVTDGERTITAIKAAEGKRLTYRQLA